MDLALRQIIMRLNQKNRFQYAQILYYQEARARLHARKRESASINL